LPLKLNKFYHENIIVVSWKSKTFLVSFIFFFQNVWMRVIRTKNIEANTECQEIVARENDPKEKEKIL